MQERVPLGLPWYVNLFDRLAVPIFFLFCMLTGVIEPPRFSIRFASNPHVERYSVKHSMAVTRLQANYSMVGFELKIENCNGG